MYISAPISLKQDIEDYLHTRGKVSLENLPALILSKRKPEVKIVPTQFMHEK